MSLDWPQLLAELKRTGLLVSAGNGAPTLSSVTSDSRAVTPGAVYIAVRGSQADGHRFVPDALQRGAAAVVVETEMLNLNVPQAVVRMGGAGIMRKDPDFIPAFVVNHILGGGSFTSRLYDEVREKRGLAYGVYS